MNLTWLCCPKELAGLSLEFEWCGLGHSHSMEDASPRLCGGFLGVEVLPDRAQRLQKLVEPLIKGQIEKPKRIYI